MATTEPSPHGKTTGPGAAGTVLYGHYRIAQHLGASAFSWEYRAEDVLDPISPPLAISVFLRAVADDVVDRYSDVLALGVALEDGDMIVIGKNVFRFSRGARAQEEGEPVGVQAQEV